MEHALHTRPNDDLSLLVNTSLVDIITQKIRTNIYTGKYEAGKKLVVRELADEFGVSHTPIKDALNRLVAEGYVEAPPRRSMVVRSFSNISILEILQARLMCETFCANEIIQGVKEHPEALTELQAILHNMRKLVSEGEQMNHEEWVKSEIRFHGCYMRHCGNHEIYKYYLTLDTTRVAYFIYLNTNHAPVKLKIFQQDLVEHQEIVDALEALDVTRFIQAVVRHIAQTAENHGVGNEARMKFQTLELYGIRYPQT